MSVFSCVWRQGAIGGGVFAAQRAGSSEWQVELGVVDLWLCSPSVIDNNTATGAGTSSLQQHSTYFKHVAFIQDGCKQAIASGWRCYRSMLWPPGPCHRICCRAASVRYAAEALLLKCGSERVFVVFEVVVPSSGGPALEAFLKELLVAVPDLAYYRLPLGRWRQNALAGVESAVYWATPNMVRICHGPTMRLIAWTLKEPQPAGRTPARVFESSSNGKHNKSVAQQLVYDKAERM